MIPDLSKIREMAEQFRATGGELVLPVETVLAMLDHVDELVAEINTGMEEIHLLRAEAEATDKLLALRTADLANVVKERDALTAKLAEARRVSETETEWRLVPVEPTEAMIDAACAARVKLYPGFPGEKPEPTAGEVADTIYRAMLATSPPALQSDADVERIAREIVIKWAWGTLDQLVEDIAAALRTVTAERDAYRVRAITAETDDKISRDFLAVSDRKWKAAESQVERLTKALEELVEAVTAEVNEKGGGGYILARLSDARDTLVALSPTDPETAR